MRVLVVLLVLCAPAFADDPKGFAPYPNARALCNEHVVGNTMHISWSTHATKDSLGKVVAFYEKALGNKASKQPDGTQLIEADKDRHVTIYPRSSNDKLPHCDIKPKAGEATIVMLSTAIR